MEAKKKWTNVRDCYRRDINRVKFTCTKVPKKYVYADRLSFLTPMLRMKGYVLYLVNDFYTYYHFVNNMCFFSSFAFEENSSDEDTTSLGEVKEECENTEKLEDGSGTDEVVMSTTKRKNKHTDTKDLPSQLMRIASQRNKAAYDDDDTKFLLSFRSDMRSMSKRQKLDFKIGMLHLLKDCSVNCDNLDTSSSKAQEWIYVETS